MTAQTSSTRRRTARTPNEAASSFLVTTAYDRPSSLCHIATGGHAPKPCPRGQGQRIDFEQGLGSSRKSERPMINRFLGPLLDRKPRFRPYPKRMRHFAQSLIARRRVSLRLVALDLLRLEIEPLRQLTLAETPRDPGLDQTLGQFVDRHHRDGGDAGGLQTLANSRCWTRRWILHGCGKVRQRLCLVLVAVNTTGFRSQRRLEPPIAHPALHVRPDFDLAVPGRNFIDGLFNSLCVHRFASGVPE